MQRTASLWTKNVRLELVRVVYILVHRTAAAAAAASIFGQRGHEETETLPHPVKYAWSKYLWPAIVLKYVEFVFV